MSRSADLFEAAGRVMPSGVTSPVRHFEPHPFFVKRADGCHMWDVDGNRITDMCCGYGALLLGHRRQEIIEAAAAQLERGTLYCTPTEEETGLADMISGIYPSVDKVRLVNTGGEATMTAIRLARGYTKRNKILKFEGCYHGAHDSVLVGAGSGAAHCGVPASAGVPEDTSQNTLVAEYNDMAAVESVIAEHHDTLACVIVEPVMANMGLVLPESGFLEKLRRLTERHGILLIFDEVVTGFRMALGGAQQYYNVTPDITTLAKSLSNGFGIAAVGGRKDVMDMLAPGGPVYQASTFAGNPVAVSAAAASVRIMNRLQSTLYPKLDRLGRHLAKAVDDMASSYGIPHAVSQAGSMMQIFFTDADKVRNGSDALKCNKDRFRIMCREMLRCGVFVAPSQFEVAFLSNAHEQDDMDAVMCAYDAGLRAASNE